MPNNQNKTTEEVYCDCSDFEWKHKHTGANYPFKELSTPPQDFIEGEVCKECKLKIHLEECSLRWEYLLELEIRYLLTPSTHAGNPPIKDFHFWHNKDGMKHITERLKDFLRSSLLRQKEMLRKEVVEGIENKKRILEVGGENDAVGIALAHTTLVHNSALSDSLAIINKILK